MVITYHGGEFFKVSFGDTTLAFNPISKDSKLKGTRFGADIALISLNHPDTNGADQVALGDRQPFVIDGPGEYEVKGVVVRGFGTASSYGREERVNTIYHVELEGMNLCFLGALSDSKLSSDILQGLDGIDILFVPVSSDELLSPADAHALAVKLEPHAIIPMHYDAAALKTFLKEEGAEGVTPVDKLTVKQKDVAVMEGQIIVLSV